MARIAPSDPIPSPRIGRFGCIGLDLATVFCDGFYGVDGGVTLLGEAASVFGALFTGVLAVATGMAGYEGLAAALLGGFLGTNFDSLLGATLQSRGYLSNNGVNLVATFFGLPRAISTSRPSIGPLLDVVFAGSRKVWKISKTPKRREKSDE